MKYLTAIWALYKGIIHRVGVVMTGVWMTIFYFLVLGPASAIALLLRKDLLQTRPTGESLYKRHEPSPDTVERYEHIS